MQPVSEDWLVLLKRKYVLWANIEDKKQNRVYGHKLQSVLKTCISLMEEFILMPGEEEIKIFYSYAIQKFHKINDNIGQYISE